MTMGPPSFIRKRAVLGTVESILNLVPGMYMLNLALECSCTTAVNVALNTSTVKLSETKLWTLPPLVLGGIIENQNSDFVMT
jgi:hypothetical protein